MCTHLVIGENPRLRVIFHAIGGVIHSGVISVIPPKEAQPISTDGTIVQIDRPSPDQNHRSQDHTVVGQIYRGEVEGGDQLEGIHIGAGCTGVGSVVEQGLQDVRPYLLVLQA